MPDLFSPYKLKGITLRNRIAMSPMTMYNSVDGRMDDYHVMYLGARAAGGFGLVFPEQVAITADGRTTTSCAGIWDDSQIESHSRVTAMIKRMGGVPAIQLGHTGRKGSEIPPHIETNAQGTWKALPPDHPEGWMCVAPSAIPYGGDHTFEVHALTLDEIKALHRSYADAARRAAEAGYQWVQLHFAHGYLASSFFSPLANHRTDEYGGSLRNRARFLLDALDAVREVWPEDLPLTMRLGSDDMHPEGVQFDESLEVIGWMKEHGLDLADVSLGVNTDEMVGEAPWVIPGLFVERAARVRREIGIPVSCSWNLGNPEVADSAIREDKIDIAMLGRPALTNPHWPLFAARELGHEDPFSMLPADWGWWLRHLVGDASSIGLPPARNAREIVH